MANLLQRNTTYGNMIGPDDKEAWMRYLKESQQKQQTSIPIPKGPVSQEQWRQIITNHQSDLQSCLWPDQQSDLGLGSLPGSQSSTDSEQPPFLPLSFVPAPSPRPKSKSKSKSKARCAIM